LPASLRGLQVALYVARFRFPAQALFHLLSY
jgi:hypothetical protein